jgi:hypothetical protein
MPYPITACYIHTNRFKSSPTKGIDHVLMVAHSRSSMHRNKWPLSGPFQIPVYFVPRLIRAPIEGEVDCAACFAFCHREIEEYAIEG